ncbi:MAG TPA: hypothetical protein PKI32_02055 [Opitutales bacterium]|nr:hypothetical protein [Opitutales bacterium]
MKQIATILVALLLASSALRAEKGVADPRVAPLLDAINKPYNIDSDGDYKLILRFDDSRSQLLYVNSNTNTFGNMEIREVWSPAVKADDGLTYDQMKRLLVHNDKVKIGAWRIMTMNGKDVAVYAVQMPAASDAETLKNVIQAVSVTADEMEKEMLGTDDL